MCMHTEQGTCRFKNLQRHNKSENRLRQREIDDAILGQIKGLERCVKQSDFSRDHFQFVLGQVEHGYAGLSERCCGPRHELVVAEVQRADGGHSTECMGESTQKVVA